MLTDHLAGKCVVDANLRLLRAFRQDRVDRNDRDAGSGGSLHGRHDAIDVDSHDDHAIHLLLNVGLDRIVLGGRIVVGVEDDELGACFIGCLLCAIIHLVEEQGLLIDLDQRKSGLLSAGRPYR